MSIVELLLWPIVLALSVLAFLILVGTVTIEPRRSRFRSNTRLRRPF